MEPFRIDIAKSEFQGLRGLKIIGYIFSIFFFALGIFYLTTVINNSEDATKYITAVMPFIIGIAIILQIRGKGIFSKYIIVNDEAVEWKRVTHSVLYWREIQSVKFEFTSFRFQMKNSLTKILSLDNISMNDVKELKEKITLKCVRNKIEILEK
ncbi:MAG: hypothetical protein ABI204_01400 [Ginsengibacter sp.]